MGEYIKSNEIRLEKEANRNWYGVLCRQEKLLKWMTKTNYL